MNILIINGSPRKKGLISQMHGAIRAILFGLSFFIMNDNQQQKGIGSAAFLADH